jgi:hypothetical protein
VEPGTIFPTVKKYFGLNINDFNFYFRAVIFVGTHIAHFRKDIIQKVKGISEIGSAGLSIIFWFPIS